MRLLQYALRNPQLTLTCTMECVRIAYIIRSEKILHLILVVVDDALVHEDTATPELLKKVLILVVMDDELVPSLN